MPMLKLYQSPYRSENYIVFQFENFMQSYNAQLNQSINLYDGVISK